MKPAYWIIPGLVIGAIVGAAIASVNQPDQPAPIAQSPVVQSPIAPSVQPTPSPTPAPPLASPPPSPAAPSVSPTPQASLNNSPLTIDGIGPVKIGMTIAEASRAAGVSIVSRGDSGNPSCTYFRPQGEPQELGFMVTEGRISRIDVFKNRRIKTPSGLGIGSTEAEIKARFPGQIEVTNHEYVQGGHYLTFVPRDAADRRYRIVFETDASSRVTQFRAGKPSEVSWVEGCA